MLMVLRIASVMIAVFSAWDASAFTIGSPEAPVYDKALLAIVESLPEDPHPQTEEEKLGYPMFCEGEACAEHHINAKRLDDALSALKAGCKAAPTRSCFLHLTRLSHRFYPCHGDGAACVLDNTLDARMRLELHFGNLRAAILLANELSYENDIYGGSEGVPAAVRWLDSRGECQAAKSYATYEKSRLMKQILAGNITDKEQMDKTVREMEVFIRNCSEIEGVVLPEGVHHLLKSVHDTFMGEERTFYYNEEQLQKVWKIVFTKENSEGWNPDKSLFYGQQLLAHAASNPSAYVTPLMHLWFKEREKNIVHGGIPFPPPFLFDLRHFLEALTYLQIRQGDYCGAIESVFIPDETDGTVLLYAMLAVTLPQNLTCHQHSSLIH